MPTTIRVKKSKYLINSTPNWKSESNCGSDFPVVPVAESSKICVWLEIKSMHVVTENTFGSPLSSQDSAQTPVSTMACCNGESDLICRKILVLTLEGDLGSLQA